MVRKSNPNQLDLVAHPFGVAVQKLDRDALRRPEDPAQWAGEF
jgi:hypothetical protein